MKVKIKNKQYRPSTVISLSLIAVIAVGTFLLTMPFSSVSREFTPPIDAFFTAVSATCVTGLSIYDTGSYWSLFGQIVIIIMIQIGGLGLVTIASFFRFMIRKKMELRSMQVASESVNTSGFYDVKELVRHVIKVTFFCEITGAVLLCAAFIPKYGVLKGIYISVYTAVSAFCNAGFDVMGLVEEPGSGLASCADNPLVVIVTCMLISAGGLGFYVWQDIMTYRSKKRLSLQSKLVIYFTLALIILGMVTTLVIEWNNENTIGNESVIQKIAHGFFYSVAMRTAGFATFDPAELMPLMKIFSIGFMFIGGAPGSTAGGIKITTFAVVVMTVVSVIRGKSDTVIMGRKVDKDLVYKSLSIIVIFFTLILVTSIVIFYVSTDIDGVDVAYEVTSAMATVGYTAGVSAEGGVWSKLLLALNMFIGRIGPISFAIAFSSGYGNTKSKNEVYPEAKLMIG